MNESLRIATWNVSCGIFNKNLQEGLPNLRYIGECLSAISADLVCMQEFPMPSNVDNGESMRWASELGYPYAEFLPLSPSHLFDGRMGLAILSRRPLVRQQTRVFSNPELSSTFEEQVIKSHDKGALSVLVQDGGSEVEIICLHLIPFDNFGIDPASPSLDLARQELKMLLATACSARPTFVCGDLNVPDIDHFLTDARHMFGLNELMHWPTRPSGRADDHLLHTKHFSATCVETIRTLSDHHICIADLAQAALSDAPLTNEGVRSRPFPASQFDSVSILHLSDLHFGDAEVGLGDWKTPITFAVRETQRNALIKFIEGKGLPRCPDFVVVSGDITVAGSAAGWKSYLQTIEPLIRAGCLPPANRFVLVPGNHDVTRTKASDASPSEASRWTPFVDAIGDRHPRAWIPAVDKPAEQILSRAIESMDESKPIWGGVLHETDSLTSERNSVSFPFLYDRQRGVLIYAFNSASISGSTTALPQSVFDDMSFLQKLEGPHQSKLMNVINEFNELRQIDPARIDPRELSLFQNLMAALTAREGQALSGILKVAVLHHHVTPIFPEEVKSFETLLNAGQLKHLLQQEGFQLILHGHKHWGEPFIDTAISGGGAHVVVSGGTIGGHAPAGKKPGFYWIEWQRQSHELKTRFVNVLGISKPKLAFDGGDETVYRLRPQASTGQLQLVLGKSESRKGIDFWTLSRETERQLLMSLRNSGGTDQFCGWSHRLKRLGISTIATAYGLKILALIDTQSPQLHKLYPQIVQSLLASRKSNGGWSAASQGAVGRPEATAWVLEALHAWQPGSPLVNDVAQALEQMLNDDPTCTAWQYTLSASLALRALSTASPNSPLIPRIASILLSAAGYNAAGEAKHWSEHLNDFRTEAKPGLMNGSPVHTAHAILALQAAAVASGGAYGLEKERLLTARDWLAMQEWKNCEEQIRCAVNASNYEQLTVNHYTAPWAIVALLQLGSRVDEPKIVGALQSLLKTGAHGLWNWNHVDTPIWATHDALLAIRTAVVRGVTTVD